MEYRYTVHEIGNIGIIDANGNQIPAAVLLGSVDAIRALGLALFKPLAIRVLFDSEPGKGDPPVSETETTLPDQVAP